MSEIPVYTDKDGQLLSHDEYTCPECGMNKLDFKKAETENERLIKMLHEWEEHEARYRADSKRLDKLEKALATNQIVSVECGYYDHGSGEGGFFLCDLSDEQLCGHSIREAIDKLEEQKP